MRLAQPVPRWLPAAVVACGAVAFVAAGSGLFLDSALDWLSSWGTSWLFLIGTVACAVRTARSDRDRGAWAAFTLAGLCWTLANFSYAVFEYPTPPSVLSLADAGYLAFPLFFAAGIVRYAGARLPRLGLTAWLDGAIVALGAAAVAAAVIFASVTVHTNALTGVVTTLAYPVEDVAVVGLLLGTGWTLGWRLGRCGALITAAIVCITASDAVTLTQVLRGLSYGGAWSNAGWTAGIALLAAAAASDADTGPRRRPRSGPRGISVPVLASVAAVGVILLDAPLRLHGIALALACAAILVVVARFALTIGEVQRRADHRWLVLTDHLTGLANRRRLLDDLAAAQARAAPHQLTLLDLDGFRAFNDSHGHAAGDKLLASLAAALEASLPAGGRAYRVGGDEFCTLVPGARGERSDKPAAIAALTAAGPGWTIAPAWGTVRVDTEAEDPAAALGLADRRMRAQKRRRPGSARQQVRDTLLLALGEQQPALRDHSQEVTDNVERLARWLGMSEDAVDDAVRAAELHDIGKLAIPARILDKPGPLDDDERAVIQTHTIVGERMLLAATSLQSVAPIVRASHERWDGAGYPDGIAGAAIPLAARIVSVCDSFDAMVAERPYRPARTPAEALAELRACAGTQFDPDVVAAFERLQSPAPSAPSPAGASPPPLQAPRTPQSAR